MGMRIAIYCLLMTLLPMLASLGARWHWTLELVTHFPLQYAIGLAIALLLGVCLRRRWIILLASVGLILCGWQLAPLYIPATPATAHGSSLRFLLANVHTANANHQRLLDLIEHGRPDVIVLLETNGAWIEALSSLNDTYPYRELQPRGDNFGMAVYSRVPMKEVKVIELAGSTVPTISAQAEIGEDIITFISTHPLPPVSSQYAKTRDRQLVALAELVSRTTGPVVVLGDLNTTSWSPRFADLLRDANLRDSRQGFGLHGT